MDNNYSLLFVSLIIHIIHIRFHITEILPTYFLPTVAANGVAHYLEKKSTILGGIIGKLLYLCTRNNKQRRLWA